MKVSILDLVTLREGQTYKEAMDDMIRLAQKAEDLDYERFWIAEHHNAKSIASSATTLLMQQALMATKHLRIGSGGIMLPNHSPYIVAEAFGTLETLFPGRVDLGLGRAPGTDMVTARAIRRSDNLNPEFPDDLALLQSYFEDTNTVHAYPAAGLSVPFYILGSSMDSAYLAAKLGLPYAFAAHFAPAMMEDAIEAYRRYFRPSKVLDKPYVILGVNAILADSNEEAESLSTTMEQSFLGLVTGQSSGLKPPMANREEVWKDYVAATKVPHFGPIAFERKDLIHRERTIVKQMTAMSLIGSPERVKEQLKDLQARVAVDELIVTSYIYDQTAQHYSYELLKQVIDSME